MVFSRGFSVSSIRIIFVGILLLFYTCQVHSQSPTAETSEMTGTWPGGTSPSITAEIKGTTPSDGEESTLLTDSGATNTDDTSPTTPFSATTMTTSFSSVTTTFTTSSETIEYTTFNSTSTTTTTTTTTTTVAYVCFGKFPFGSTCINPGANGGVVITAFILSIVSFIGVIGAASYMLFFRKYFSPKKNRMMTNYNVPGQTVDIHDEPEIGNRAKGKKKGASPGQSSSHQKSKQTGPQLNNITDLDDGQF